MSKKKIIIISIIVGILVLIAYRWENPKKVPDNVAPGTEDSDKNGSKKIPEPPPPSSGNSQNNNNAETENAGFLPTKMEDPQRFEAFSKNMLALSQCLNIKTETLDPNSELSFDTFNSLLKPALGDVVTQETIWTSSDIKTKTGELRRIYVQQESDSDNGVPTRTLKYYSLSADGSQKEIPLSEDQTINPSDTLIASLESDGSLMGNSSAKRVYYKNGDDMLMVERSGKIYSFELPHGGKVFTCKGADAAETMKCACQ
ncbi:MAG: hypothetical protein ACXVCP_05030 [Bdellovibrio sp.]